MSAYEIDSYYTECGFEACYPEYGFFEFYMVALLAYAFVVVPIVFMVKKLFRTSEIYLELAFVLFMFWPFFPFFLFSTILVVQHELYRPLFESHYVIAAAFSCLALVAALWPVRRCQTCGRRVNTYCHECETREADWTDPEA